MVERRLIAVALPYINNLPHLGHIAGAHLPGDIFARFCRLKGYDVLLIGGSDENGTPAELAAESINIPLKKFLDRIYKEHVKTYNWFNISYDNFSRTSRKIHHETTVELFNKIYSNGFVSEGNLDLFYCSKDRRFLPDRYVEGTCAKCGYKEAHGDQCDKCTALLDTKELIDPRCKICGTKPELRKTKHLFLELSKLSKELDTWVKNNKHWRTQVSSVALGWIKEGLRDRCITRDLKHGVKVPLKGYEDKVFYVWFDAPIGYISSTKEKTASWKRYWQDPKTKIYNFIGKDNIPFHTIFWPGMIIANSRYNLPYNVVGLQYLNYEGGKFSKSKKRGVFCEKLPKTGLNSDLFRAYLTFVLPETSDSEFKWTDFQNRINNDIIGNLGNFVNRTVSFAHNKLGGIVSKPKDLSPDEKKLIKTIKELSTKIESSFESVELRMAFRDLLAISDRGNRYFDHNKPWGTLSKNRKDTERVIYFCLEICRVLSILSSPFLPESSEKIWKTLGLKVKKDWKSAFVLGKERSYSVKKPKLLFNKLTDGDIVRVRKIASDTTDLKDFFK